MDGPTKKRPRFRKENLTSLDATEFKRTRDACLEELGKIVTTRKVDFPPKKKKKPTDVEVPIDLTMSSSPVPESIDPDAVLRMPHQTLSRSSPVISDDEIQVCIASQHYQIMN